MIKYYIGNDRVEEVDVIEQSESHTHFIYKNQKSTRSTKLFFNSFEDARVCLCEMFYKDVLDINLMLSDANERYNKALALTEEIE